MTAGSATPNGSQNAADQAPITDPVSRSTVAIGGLILLIVPVILLYLVIQFWPTKPQSPATPKAVTTTATVPKGVTTVAVPIVPVPLPTPTWNPTVKVFKTTYRLDPEIRFLWLVAIFGALGSYIQMVTSFTTYLGNRRFGRSWLWWYALRIPVGMFLALLFYVALRGGFFTAVSGGTDVNPFGVAALGGLVGMFSRQASDKLAEIFTDLFKNNQDADRGGKLQGPPAGAPTVSGTTPSTLSSTADTDLTIAGSNFVDGSKVIVNDTSYNPTLLDAAHLKITVQTGDVKTTGNSLKVVNPDKSESDAYQIQVA